MAPSLLTAVLLSLLTHTPVFLVWTAGALIALLRRSVSRRVAGLLVGGLGLAACGEHTYVNLDKVDAARLPDGRVRVTATVGCEQVGSTPCKSVGDYCVLVEWGDASAPTDRQCVKTTLTKGSEQVVEVTSGSSPPPGARAVVTLVGAGGGPVIHIGTRGSPTTVDVP